MLVSIHAALMFVMIFVSFLTPGPLVALSAVGSLLLADVFVLVLNRRGRVSLAARLFTASLWLVIAVLTVFLGGVYGVAFSAYLVVVAVAGFLLGGQGGAVVAAFSILAGLGVAWAQENNALPAALGESTPIFMWLALSVYVLLMVAIVVLATRNLYAALARARTSEQALTSNLRQLEESRDALDAQAHLLERQTAKLQAAAEVSRSVVSILDMEELFWQAADLLIRRFDLYHVGVFQLDGTGRWAEYRAGAGEAGQLLAEQQFRLAVGGDSMIGWCTAQSQPRIVQDVDSLAAASSLRPQTVGDRAGGAGRLDHPLVPRTRSEAALPLIARGRVIGALSLQSDRPGTFDLDTVAILQTIADQLAITMDNARLLASSQQALEAASRAYGESTRQAWAELLRGRGSWGYRYQGAGITPLESDGQVEAPHPPGAGTGVATVDIPLKIRDKVVGILSFQKEMGQPADRPEGTWGAGSPGPDVSSWTEEETRLLERLVEQTALALDSARLYQDTQRRAAQERLVGEVTARMRETLDMDAVLRTAAQEIRQALGLSRLSVRLAAEAEGGGEGGVTPPLRARNSEAMKE
ncbi:MAG: GAF domain-containing protein [Anaerolineae bacterium]|nr:GAF domain-containing protein [Anaerolineae bacterium]